MVKLDGEYWMCKVGEFTFCKLATPESDIVMVKSGKDAYVNAFAVREATQESFQAACEGYVERHSHAKGGKPPAHQPPASTRTSEPEEAPEPATMPVEGSDLVQTLLDI